MVNEMLCCISATYCNIIAIFLDKSRITCNFVLSSAASRALSNKGEYAMLAIRLEPAARRQYAAFDRSEPAFRPSRKTLVALASVAIFYAGLGALVVTQKVVLKE